MAIARIVKASQGKWLLKGMFFEMCPPHKREEYCSFTLKEDDHEGYVSMKKLYLQYNDPTEYQFAIEVLGNYSHWKLLSNCDWFKPYVESWRDEMEAKLTSEAVRQIALASMEEKGFQAAKWLAEKGYKEKQVGAKSKAAKAKEAKINQMVDEDLEKDAVRLGLRAIK